MNSDAYSNVDYKKEPLTNGHVVSAPKLIRVVAPTNLPGGYQLEVQTDNDPPIPFTVNVPMAGVKAGDVFLVPPPPGYEPPYPQIEAPTGRWKDGLCDFFTYGVCHAQIWLSLCCTEIARGQIMHRFRLTWIGDLIEPHSPINTFRTVLTIVLAYFVFDVALTLYVDFNAEEAGNLDDPVVWTVSQIKSFVGLCFTFWSIYSLYKLRKHVRMTYSIPEERCTGCEDLVCSTFCACCTVAQIARHTGEYEKYPSLCCTDTGLSNHAPMVV